MTAWLTRATEAGNVDAMYNLGGIADERGDTLSAMDWWQKAATAGDPQAMHNLGYTHYDRGE
jgi:hypothetical protein